MSNCVSVWCTLDEAGSTVWHAVVHAWVFEPKCPSSPWQPAPAAAVPQLAPCTADRSAAEVWQSQQLRALVASAWREEKVVWHWVHVASLSELS